MADLVFSGLKLAYKAFKAYSDVKSELGEFEEDFEELEMRLQALDPVINALEDKLTDELTMVLTIAKREQEKANAYTKELFEYCRRFKEKGTQFKAIATALASKAVDSLPDGLREGAQALMPVVAKHGVPEKAYAKFAEKLHFLMSSLSAAAATQALQGSGDGKKSSSTPAAAPAVTVLSHGDGESKGAEGVEISAAEQVERLNEMMTELVEEEDEDFRAIFLKRFVASGTYVFALWVDKVPHLLFVGYYMRVPAVIEIRRAPSTKYLVELTQNGLPRKRFTGPNLELLKEQCASRAAKEMKVSLRNYNRRHKRSVINKWMCLALVPGLNLFVACCGPCLCQKLQMRDFQLNDKVFNVRVENGSEIYVNDQMLLDTSTLEELKGFC